MKGSILIISGPSGSGKSSLMKELLKTSDDIYFSISTTTREMRVGEEEGVNYYYISQEEFQNDIKEGAFLEWAKVHENYYGTSLKPILKALEDGKLVVFDIDVQGHEIARRKFGNLITSVFLTTANQKILRQRLEARQTDSKDSIDQRISNALEEMARMREYDYLLINDNFEDTFEKLKAIAEASRYKISALDTQEFTDFWANKD
jgi:guanylate kinase